MTSVSTLAAFSNDPDLAARAILDASQPVHKTPPRKERSNDDVVTFTPSGVATPARLQHKSQSGHNSPKVPEFNVLASSGQHSSSLASSARRPPLPHPTSESSSPFTIRKPADHNNVTHALLPQPNARPRKFVPHHTTVIMLTSEAPLCQRTPSVREHVLTSLSSCLDLHGGWI